MRTTDRSRSISTTSSAPACASHHCGRHRVQESSSWNTSPGDGRPYPPEEKANDLVHWQTKFLGSSAAQAELELRKARSVFVSAGVVHGSILVRDPDGHALQIAEQ